MILEQMSGGGTIDFGEKGDSGTLFWAPLTLGIADTGPGFSVNVNAGTLRDGDGSLGQLLGIATSTMVEQYGKIDLHGYAETIANLGGSGTITSNKTGGALTSSRWRSRTGAITGSLSLAIRSEQCTLDGVPTTILDGTTIDKGAHALILAYSGSWSTVAIDDQRHLKRTLSGNDAASISGGITIDNGGTVNWYSAGYLAVPWWTTEL